MKKIVEVKNDRYFVMGCMNITLKSFMPCSSCGYWKDDKCESPDLEGELADMYQIIKGRWEIMKFDIPHDEVQLDVMPHSTNKPTESKENKEWWFCNKNGIMVYDQMCYDSCFIDEIIACPDVKNKPQKTIAEEHIPSQTKREPAYSDGKLVKATIMRVDQLLANINTPRRFSPQEVHMIKDMDTIIIDGGELTGKHEFKIDELNLVELQIVKNWLSNQLCEAGEREQCNHPHGHCEKCGSHRISIAHRESKEIARCHTCGHEWEHKSKSEGDE